ncbi:hypothetical protein [Streptosporangium sp. NPDC003464]
MTLLTYTVLTDPAPLEASAAGRPSTGTVYLVITNTGQQAAYWSTIEVEVPVGNGVGDLTPDVNKIKPKGEYGPRSGTRSSVDVRRVPQSSNAFQATAPGGRASFAPGDHMVLKLENVTVTPTAGLAVLKVTEKAGRTKTGSTSNSFAAVALVKTAPKELPAPRDFRPDKAMVDAGEKLTLRWEGSAGFGYKIMYPGAPQPVSVSGGSWSPPDAPKRATTYILIATDRNTQQQHFLTTTVQVRNPVLETLTAINGVTTPWVQGSAKGDGAFTFSQGAMHVRREFASQEAGALHAGEATVDGVGTGYVKGRNSGEGDITFTQGGVKVWRARESNEPGTLHAGEATFNGVGTGYVEGINSGDGHIRFLPNGVKVLRARESSYEGTLRVGEATISSLATGIVNANKITANEVNTDRVKGKGFRDGWITFPQDGIQVSSGLYDTPRSGAVYAETGMFRNQSFSGGRRIGGSPCRMAKRYA